MNQRRFVGALLAAVALAALAQPQPAAPATLIMVSAGRGASSGGGGEEGINAAADWAIRSSGADCAQNFSTFANTTDLRNWENVSNPTTLSLTTEHALSGKAARLTTLDTDEAVAQGFLSTLNCRRMKGQSSNADVFTEVTAQVVVYMDDFVDWPFRSTSQNAPKVFILDREPLCDICSGYGPNSNEGEIVIDNDNVYGFINSYRRRTDNGLDTPWHRTQSTPGNSSNFARQNAVDRGTALTDEASYQRRYGPTYSGMSCTSPTAGVRFSVQCPTTHPDPDAAIGGITYNKGGFTVLEMCADYSNDRVKIWAAHYGDDPLLVYDSDLDNVNGNTAHINGRADISGWAGVSLLTYRTNGIAEVGVRPSPIHVDYPELIIRTGSSASDAIPFPGNKSLPSAGCDS